MRATRGARHYNLDEKRQGGQVRVGRETSNWNAKNPRNAGFTRMYVVKKQVFMPGILHSCIHYTHIQLVSVTIQKQGTLSIQVMW